MILFFFFPCTVIRWMFNIKYQFLTMKIIEMFFLKMYIHTYKHTDIHMYVHTNIHTYIHTNITFLSLKPHYVGILKTFFKQQKYLLINLHLNCNLWLVIDILHHRITIQNLYSGTISMAFSHWQTCEQLRPITFSWIIDYPS